VQVVVANNDKHDEDVEGNDDGDGRQEYDGGRGSVNHTQVWAKASRPGYKNTKVVVEDITGDEHY
jgi:hypothetical protein